MNNSTCNERGSLFTVSAPSGTGKTSLVEALIARNSKLGVSVSHTTRPMREGEENGINYHFVSPEEFERMLNEEQFLEHATVYDYRYGTSRDYVERSLASGLDVILEIDWQGARQVRQKFSGCVSIFILPPSREALYARLCARAQDDEEVIQRRMAAAVSEMSHFGEADYLLINDSFDTTLEQLECIIASNRLRTSLQRVCLHSTLDALLGE